MFPQLKGVPLPDNAATIDHIISKTEGRKSNGGPKVLACKKCNQLRGDTTVKQFKTKYQIWLAANSFPRIALKNNEQEAVFFENKACDRCSRLGSFKFESAQICQDCFMTCLTCNEIFILGEDDNQNICWRCLKQNERDQKAAPYRAPKLEARYADI